MDGQLTLNLTQAQVILESFGGDPETQVVISRADEAGHSGPGLYLHWEGVPDEGSIFLGEEGESVEATVIEPDQGLADGLRLVLAQQVPSGPLDPIRILKAQQVYPNNPWRALGFWRALLALVSIYLRPWESMRLSAQVFKESVLEKVEA